MLRGDLVPLALVMEQIERPPNREIGIRPFLHKIVVRFTPLRFEQPLAFFTFNGKRLVGDLPLFIENIVEAPSLFAQ